MIGMSSGSFAPNLASPAPRPSSDGRDAARPGIERGQDSDDCEEEDELKIAALHRPAGSLATPW